MIEKKPTEILVEIADDMPKVYASGYEAGSGVLDAYWKCELTHVTVPEGVSALNPYALYNQTNLITLKLPSGLTALGASCMYGCENLELESLPNGINIIPSYSFMYCKKMHLKELPSATKVIQSQAFAVCSELSITHIPASVTTIADRAFENCVSLTTLTFEGTPTTIHAQAFSRSTNLKTINVPWSQGAVAGAPWGATNATIVYNSSDKTVFYLSDGTEWEFEEGMTWYEFCDSAYNTDNSFEAYDDTVMYGSMFLSSPYAVGNDTIINGQTYQLG